MKKDRVAAIVIENSRILLMRRINNGKEYYTFPGGGIERGETNIEALKREIVEETSVNINVKKLLYEVDWDHETKQFFYFCSYVSGRPMLGDFNERAAMIDGTQYYDPCWVEISLLSKTLLYPLEVRDFLIDDLNQDFNFPKRTIYLEIKTCRQIL